MNETIENLKELHRNANERPQSLADRTALLDAWKSIVAAYPDSSIFECPPSFANTVRKRFSFWEAASSVGAWFIDVLVEGEWRNQCNRKYGGRKPRNLSWKKFYLKNEFMNQSFNNDNDKINWTLENNHKNWLDYLLKNRIDLNPELCRKLPLEKALINGKLELIEILLDHGLDINSQLNSGWRLLHVAIFLEDLAFVKRLLRWQPDLSSVDENGVTPLLRAVYQNSKSIIYFLIAKGALKGDEKSLAKLILWAIVNGESDVAELLISNGVNLSAAPNLPFSLLHVAVLRGNAYFVELLLKHGCDVNAKDGYGRTALHWASQSGYLDIVKLLMKAGADAQVVDIFNDKAFRLAAFARAPKVVTYLAQNGAT